MAGIQVAKHLLLSIFENTTTNKFTKYKQNLQQHNIMAAPTMQQPELDTTSIPGYVIFPEQNDHASQAGAVPRSQVHPLGKFAH